MLTWKPHVLTRVERSALKMENETHRKKSHMMESLIFSFVFLQRGTWAMDMVGICKMYYYFLLRFVDITIINYQGINRPTETTEALLLCISIVIFFFFHNFFLFLVYLRINDESLFEFMDRFELKNVSRVLLPFDQGILFLFYAKSSKGVKAWAADGAARDGHLVYY